MRTGGKILVDQLIRRGIERVFCVPGESYLEILNALYDLPKKVKVFNARHEAGAANMAEAHGKMTGNPGVALVTRGPGACHASIGVHIAYQDSTPMILIIGQVSQDTNDRESFQEINYRAMFGCISKWCVEINSVERIPEYMAKAFNLAVSGRPGPVVLAVPENILRQFSEISDYDIQNCHGSAPKKNSYSVLKEMFSVSRRPLILVGGSAWCKSASLSVQNFANKYSIPVSTGFRRQDILDNQSPVFCGAFGTSVSPSLLKRMNEVDLLLVIGSRLGEMTTNGYQIFNEWSSEQKLVHVHVDASEIGSVKPPDLGIVSTVKNFSDDLLNLKLKSNEDWKDWCEILRSEYVLDLIPPKYEGLLDLGTIFAELDQRLPKNSVVTLDAGNHTGWPQRFIKYSPFRRQIGSTCGAMGYSIPAAIACALARPDLTVVSFVGDGGFLMSGMELMTAVQYDIPLIIIIFNNNSYGTIRMHQEIEHPGRVIATNLKNPKFVDLARSMGAYSEIVNETNEFFPAFQRCQNQKKPSLIELRTDVRQLSTRFSIF